MRTSRVVLECLFETLSALDRGPCAIAAGSPMRHQIIARAVAEAAYGRSISDNMTAARLGKIIDESAEGLHALLGSPRQRAAMTFFEEIGLKEAAGLPGARH